MKKNQNDPFYHNFSNDSVKQLCTEHGTLVHFKKNSILYSEKEADTPPYVYYLAEGVFSVSGIALNGREQIFLYQRPGDMIGHVPHIMSPNSSSIYSGYRRPTIIAKTACILYRIPSQIFLDYMNHNIDFSNYLTQRLAHNYSTTLAHLKQMQEDSVVSGICRLLLHMGMPTEDGILIPKMFTYSEIANYLGIHEVTASRVIGRLKQSSLLERTPSGLLIKDPDTLESIIQNPDEFKYK